MAVHWTGGNDIESFVGDGLGGGCLSFLPIVEDRGFLNITNRSVPVARHSTFVTPCLSLLVCHSVCHVVIPFHPLAGSWEVFLWQLLFILAPWRAVILLCICTQLNSCCPEQSCPHKGWTSMCSGHQLYTVVHVKCTKESAYTRLRPEKARSQKKMSD